MYFHIVQKNLNFEIVMKDGQPVVVDNKPLVEARFILNVDKPPSRQECYMQVVVHQGGKVVKVGSFKAVPYSRGEKKAITILEDSGSHAFGDPHAVAVSGCMEVVVTPSLDGFESGPAEVYVLSSFTCAFAE